MYEDDEFSLNATPELIEQFNLYDILYDKEKMLDIHFGESYDKEQNIKAHLTPQYISQNARLNTLAKIILDEAIENKSTDIQLISLTRDIGLVRLRIGEEMYPHRRIHGSAMRGLSIVFKHLSGVDINEELNAQGGRMAHIYNGSSYNIRSSFMPSMYGETVSLRILYGEQLSTDISSLGLPDVVEGTLRQVLGLSEGLILLTGGTGSGKTTTMYTSIGHIQERANYTKNVITIEDPIEYVIPGASQSQVIRETGYGFEQGLQTALRQNPDIILVGEINNPETAGTAVRAATTGHLVFSTFHSNNTLNVPIGMEHYGVPKLNLNRALSLVLNQTLPNKLCDYCKKQHVASTDEFKWVTKLGNNKPLPVVYEAEGCEKCDYNGVSGRVLCVSMLDANSVYMDIVADKSKSLEDVERELLNTDGANYYPMEFDVYRHLELGNIDLATAKSILR